MLIKDLKEMLGKFGDNQDVQVVINGDVEDGDVATITDIGIVHGFVAIECEVPVEDDEAEDV